MIKLRAPEGASISLAGRAVDINNDGSVHVMESDAETLRGHGFTDWADHPTGGDVETMSREQLVEAIVAKTREGMADASTEDLRAALRKAPRMASETAEHVTAADPEEKRISGLNRTALFAYLKENGVSAPPPISNEELIAIAIKTHRAKRI